MNLQDYIEFVKESTHPNVREIDRHFYYRAGFDGEIGEIFQLCSKALRSVTSDKPMPSDHWIQLAEECGDILYYYVGQSCSVSTSFAQWADLDAPIILRRRDALPTIAAKTSRARKEMAPVRPEGYSLEQLADLNFQKLNQRKEELGAFTKC